MVKKQDIRSWLVIGWLVKLKMDISEWHLRCHSHMMSFLLAFKWCRNLFSLPVLPVCRDKELAPENWVRIRPHCSACLERRTAYVRGWCLTWLQKIKQNILTAIYRTYNWKYWDETKTALVHRRENCLLAVWALSEVQSWRGASRTKAVFEQIQRKLAVVGYHRSVEQIVNKLKKL